ncbi:MAG: aminomethyl-transferring glycine dehydrogenase subunit GcvPA [candidate division Zixibacteria bacterium]|nr:aminomethyl-transferring glycine dehydrogenase subunit GcvPA [candidate division Zixibacteria bacterium]
MSFIPQSDNDGRTLLDAIGVKDFDELLEGVPESLRLTQPLRLPPALSELEAVRHLGELATRNQSCDEYINFMGAGAYDHYIPAIIPHLISRPEFLTAYTPYQAEVSQGTLQAIYEFQSLICRLTGMEVANASMYDGASAAAEAVLLALSVTRRRTVLLSRLLHPHFRDVIKAYIDNRDVEIVTVADDNGVIAIDDLKEKLADAACLVMANPNFYGIIEPVDQIPELVHRAGAMLIAVVNPISLALLKPPGEYDADICVGEGQPLGNALAFGGPYFGFFAARKNLVRRLPGRLAAMAQDATEKRGFCLTLQTREQHIRRDKATSNICTNQALCALAGAIYLVTMGREGIKEVAELCVNKAHYLQEKLCALNGISLACDRNFFHEFALELRGSARRLFDRLLEKKIYAGVPTSRFNWENDHLLVCATEKRTVVEMDYFCQSVKEVIT